MDSLSYLSFYSSALSDPAQSWALTCTNVQNRCGRRHLRKHVGGTHFRGLAGAAQQPVLAFPVALRTHHDFASDVGVAHLFAARRRAGKRRQEVVFFYASIRAFAEAERRVSPPRAGFLSLVAVNEAGQAHGGCQRQHDGVEAQPGEVDADLLPVVLPVKGNVPVSVYASK